MKRELGRSARKDRLSSIRLYLDNDLSGFYFSYFERNAGNRDGKYINDISQWISHFMDIKTEHFRSVATLLICYQLALDLTFAALDKKNTYLEKPEVRI